MGMISQRLASELQTSVVEPARQGRLDVSLHGVGNAFDALYDAIPDRKRISLGRVHVTRTLGRHLYDAMEEAGLPILQTAASMLGQASDCRGRGVALFIIACRAAAGPIQELGDTLLHFESAARSGDWALRELSQAFFRLVIRTHPEPAQAYLARLAQAPDANLRRFASEALRPVQENRWFYENPEYSLSVLRLLFRERDRYPRTSVGNNLSDLARRLPDLVLSIVAELVARDDKNAYWIAHRACRNLVKTQPLAVMDLLGIEEYRYKQKVYRRCDCT